MKRNRRLALVPSAAVLILAVSPLAKAQITNTCDASLWNHVYHPARLVVIHPCVSVTGTIVLRRKEADGDIHIQIRLDKSFRPLLNATNRSRQGGNLVLEPICVGKVTQADAVIPCQGLHNAVGIPNVGDHVQVTGSYVHDAQSGHGWMELHPVTSIEPD